MRKFPITARRVVLTTSAIVFSIGVMFSANAQNAAPAGPSPVKQSIENRKAVYTLIGNYFRSFGAVAKGTLAYDEADATKRAARIAFLAGIAGETFPEISNVGEPETKAKADIWINRADFDKKLKDFQDHAAVLVEVNAKEKGATDALKVAIAALGQDCKGCHDSYKAK